MSWKKLLASAKEPLNDHIRIRNDYLMAENRILRHQIEGRVQLTDSERKQLAEIGANLGKKALAEIATASPSSLPRLRHGPRGAGITSHVRSDTGWAKSTMAR